MPILPEIVSRRGKTAVVEVEARAADDAVEQEGALRLLVVATRFPPDVDSGRASAFARLVRVLGERHRMRLVVGYHRGREHVPDHALGVDLRRPGPWARLSLARATRSVARRFGPDLVITDTFETPVGPAPTIAVVRDLVETGWEEATRLEALRRRRRLQRLARIVVPTIAARRELRAAGAPEWSVDRVPDVVELPPRPPAPARGPAVLVHPGRIHPGKGQHLSVDAVSRLSPEEKEAVHLHVVGPPTDRRYYDQLRIAAQGQPITFHPEEAEPAPWFARAHLVLYPTSLPEGFADVAVAAMAHARPVVWADQPGVRESVGGVGIPVPPDDVEALRAAIRTGLADREQLRRYGREGRALVAARYTWSALAPRWEEILDAARRSRR